MLGKSRSTCLRNVPPVGLHFDRYAVSQRSLVEPESFRLVTAKHGDNVIYRNDEKLVVMFEIDGNRILGMEQDLVVLS